MALAFLSAFSARAQSDLSVLSVNAESGGRFGAVLTGAGDVNEDGITDLLIGAFGETWDGRPDAGRAYLVDGRTGYTIAGLRAPEETATLPGERGLRFGAAVAGLGDITGDGVPDLGIGAPNEDPGGAVFVFSGADGMLVRTVDSPSSMNGAFGHALASTGDVTGDGVPDLLVGAYKVSASQGRAYVFSGSDGELVHSLVASNPQAGADFGRAVAGGRDVTGDGVPDWLVAARDEGRMGRVYVFDGSTGEMSRSLESPTPSFDGQFGLAMALCGDMTGDGLAEILVGAGREADSLAGTGRAYIFDGATGDVIQSLASPKPAQQGWFGQNVVCLDDVDRDAIPDVAVSAPGESARADRSGTVYVFSGATGHAIGQLRSPHPVDHGRFGIWLATVSGPDAGAVFRVAVGADSEPAREVLSAGRVHLLPIALAPIGASSEPGRSVFQLGAPYPNPGQGQFSMDLTLPEAAQVHVQVTDALGRIVVEHAAERLPSGTHVLELDTRQLSAGTYSASVWVGGHPPRLRKMVVVR